MIDVSKVSDKIPRELIKKQEFHRNAGSHVFNVITYTPPEFIPYIYQQKICFSMGKEGHEGTTHNGSIPLCGGCKKPRQWFGHFCAGCGDFFIRDFYDPRFCDYYPTCWDCLSELPWAHCPDHFYANSIFAHLEVAPAGLNPTKFTQEELDNVFDFEW